MIIALLEILDDVVLSDINTVWPALNAIPVVVVVAGFNTSSTVKVADQGFYEVFVKNSEFESAKPKVRIPINEVIMFIEE